MAEELKIPKDWLNTHFTDFTYVVPGDFGSRLRKVFQGRHLTVDGFGPEDLAIMKLMAARPKDRPHLRRLVRLKGIDFSLIEGHLLTLKLKGLPRTEQARALG